MDSPDTPRYWVTLTWTFGPALPEADACIPFWNALGDALDATRGFADTEVSVGSDSLVINGVVHALDEEIAIKAAREMILAALKPAAATRAKIPSLPVGPHQPDWEARQLLGRASDARAVLLVAA